MEKFPYVVLTLLFDRMKSRIALAEEYAFLPKSPGNTAVKASPAKDVTHPSWSKIWDIAVENISFIISERTSAPACPCFINSSVMEVNPLISAEITDPVK